MPDSPLNRDAGMFMVTVELLSFRNQTVHIASRPVCLRESAAWWR
jgi:hypothetical protein